MLMSDTTAIQFAPVLQQQPPQQPQQQPPPPQFHPTNYFKYRTTANLWYMLFVIDALAQIPLGFAMIIIGQRTTAPCHQAVPLVWWCFIGGGVKVIVALLMIVSVDRAEKTNNLAYSYENMRCCWLCTMIMFIPLYGCGIVSLCVGGRGKDCLEQMPVLYKFVVALLILFVVKTIIMLYGVRKMTAVGPVEQHRQQSLDSHGDYRIIVPMQAAPSAPPLEVSYDVYPDVYPSAPPEEI